LKKHYALLKKIMEFTWRRDNPDLWDPEETGVLTGRQHHTLDMELFGANSWLTGFYLGALKAMVSMAAVCGDDVFSQKCAQLLQKGQQEVKKCFNGTHFCQPIDLKKVSLLDNWEEIKAVYWNEECGELKYQIGEGVAIDACLGEFFASFYGIGHVLDEKMTRQTLRKIFSDNFRSMKEHINPWRSFAVNDEKGVCICTWSQNKPAIPLPYNSEMMNGFEWAFASHLLLCGMNEEALQVIRAVRQRYDGVKRNPWNEFECGSNYARSMASFALLPIISGFKFDLPNKTIGFAPKKKGYFRSFFSVGSAWGNFIKDKNSLTVNVLFGNLELKHFIIPNGVKPKKLIIDGVDVAYSIKSNKLTFNETIVTKNLKIEF
jgi:uncharacterized protein (DUF608 family)